MKKNYLARYFPLYNVSTTDDDIRDIAIRIVNKLVDNGLVKDCTDTDDETEFEFQDIIFDVLKENL